MSVFLADEQGEELDLAGMRGIAELVISKEGYPHETEVTLLFVDEDEMSSYNERFLNRSGPTDVLAFPVEDLLPGVAPDADPSGPPLMIGDVIIAPGYVRRQAGELEVEFEDEMALMVTHGILHLMGYNHQADGDAAVMETREAELLALVGKKRR
ncbi:MAG TPA: rRNA maturation RNase YbeY [Acidimicrobiia bacterium]|nr:rRNA maturation RNase YbeY [Acidimicrobiia bacterium]